MDRSIFLQKVYIGNSEVFKFFEHLVFFQVTEKMAKEIEDLRLKESVAVEEQKKLSRSVR